MDPSGQSNAIPTGAGRSFRLVAFLACLLAAAIVFVTSPAGLRAQDSSADPGPAFVLDIKGAIGVGTRFYIEDGFAEAQRRRASLIILRMDTPGGLVSATREIISLILSSPIPVAVYVAPTGARAASAGTYLSYAAHIAAMAPGTHLGAATPVRMGMPGTPSTPKPGSGNDKKSGSGDAMQNKILNDAIAYLRSLAQLRGRNAEWAEKAVRDAATLTATEAAREKVIDFEAGSIPDLLRKANGREVKVGNATRTIATANAVVVEHPQSWKAKFLAAITNPNIAFILLLVGFYGIVFEFWSPGLGGSGVVGAVCLITAFAALSMLPLNYAGLALLLLGMALMIAEGFAPGFGILGIGGLVAFILGGLFLFDPSGADFDFGVAWPVVVSAAITTAALFIIALGMIARVRRQPVVSGSEYMIGAEARIVEWHGDHGRVRVHGEVWGARAGEPLQEGQVVAVRSRDGLTLVVAPSGKED